MTKKIFSLVSLSGSETFFTEDSIPDWLLSKEYRWFMEKHVLKLAVGESIETDLSKITRIS